MRIERGQATEEELAAIAVTLISLGLWRRRPAAPNREGRSVALWRPAGAGAFQAPHSWR
ncbi:acyl-CoA carboxylase epsilon subunit [Streptomyces sp. NPDC017979]|uniref:acyl-CoA carboxylase epsilon subunit n=1 Tax=unclassified Streptomyces TaxID=2593676 RepID=UPI00379D4E20